ncbi:MAG: phenylalanine--tRNA ligase subunit beta [Nitrosospira sp.]|nr:phenylalanine--tRNA ligase subunit beta [Nitrosospira sp.]MBI0419378.1 phenylalanine--tRNA ligase subunit beta [Nitrosospira sp.]
MKFSENWLRTLVNSTLSSSELAHALTMAGLEVETIEPVAPFFDKVVVGEVLSIQKHPDADRLSICQVNVNKVLGDERLQIVCGATNIHVGAKVPCALIGAQLPTMVIHQTKVRGVESHGMLCSTKELGLSEVATGLLLLSDDAPVGADFRNYYELSDKIFTLKLTPNRGDCLGLLGLAREVAAISSVKFNFPKTEPVKNKISGGLIINVEAMEACPLYCGRVICDIDLDVPTPTWMVRRLERSGIRTINAVVDATNYVMLETGQPLHAFNLAKIAGGLSGTVCVRYANSDEQLTLLNGQNLVLQADMLLIADEISPLALAGIMGGSESRVEHGTTSLFLESAFFDPKIIIGKSVQLGFSSDSSYRFERGVDFENTRNAMERTTSLIISICGGKAGPITEVKGKLPLRDPVCLRAKRVKRILGIDLGESKITELLQRLQFNFSVDNGIFHVIPPTYRFDINIEEDLIEELVRIHGYDLIPVSLPYTSSDMLPEFKTLQTPSRVRRVLIARDYQEVINYAFVDALWEKNFANNKTPIILKNPISSQMSVMRSSLFGGLISNLQFNLNRKQSRVRLFEIGNCFIQQEKGYIELEKLAGICYGDRESEQWGVSPCSVDFYDIKADIEALFWPKIVTFEAVPHPAFHPGKSGLIQLDGKAVGWLGELHPLWQQKADLPKSAVLFELDLDALMIKILSTAEKIAKFLPVRRDLAIIVSNNISVQILLNGMRALDLPSILEISLFDIYCGEGVEKGTKSLAFRVLLQSAERTLTDVETDVVIEKLIHFLRDQFGAKLRS